jgi:predicted GNAT family N-acyltransferase
VTGYRVLELTTEQTYPLRLAVLRFDTVSKVVTFPEDDLPGTVHLGLHDGDDVVAISSWVPRPYDDQPAVQLRGMATATHMQGKGAGGLLIEAGCERAALSVSFVWARARDAALPFYERHGFVVEGDGFIDDLTQKPHHVIVRRLK